MAIIDSSIEAVKQREGGYNRPYGLKLCGIGSGETYVGIDRNCFNNWAGWKVIDNYKRKFNLAEEQVIADDTLDHHVSSWYIDYLNKLISINQIQSQPLADFVADFLVHKQYDAIKIINYVARQLKPNVQTSSTKVTPQVIDLMNLQTATFYSKLYQARKDYYRNPFKYGSFSYFKPATVQSFLARVASFPETLQTSYLDYWNWNNLFN